MQYNFHKSANRSVGSVANLINLVVEEVSLVDEPANPGAQVTMYKRSKDKEDLNMTKEELSKLFAEALAPINQEIASLQKSIGEIQKSDTEKMTEEEKAKAEKEAADEEAAEKSEKKADEDLKKALDAKEDVIKEMTSKQVVLEKAIKEVTSQLEKAQLEKEVESVFKNLPGDTDSKVELLKLAKGNEKVMELLTKADNLTSKSLGEIGTDSQAKSKDSDIFEKGLSEYMKTNNLTSRTAATVKFLDTSEGRDLYKKSLS